MSFNQQLAKEVFTLTPKKLAGELGSWGAGELGSWGAGVLGAGVLGAEVLGAGVLGAGVLGAGEQVFLLSITDAIAFVGDSQDVLLKAREFPDFSKKSSI